ncbi:unnamed protein product [Angiostrongylus costaricensis]|uniref:INCENP_ARK-bind domain-containing protein n=1 Tax=Angiostrongylus costaricensis TaxID=334426 RepID=A0A0R3PLU7_ANGCS|nr:unnamed protein product [Angiostrongylus costaricensis]
MRKEQERQERFLRSCFYCVVSFSCCFDLCRFCFRLREEERRRVKVFDDEAQTTVPKEEEKSFIYEQNKIRRNVIVMKRFSQTSNVNYKLASRHSSYEITPGKVHKPSSENNYGIDDLSSGDETDQEEAPRKKVPSWAVGKEFQCELRRQAAILRSGEFDLSEYFGEVEAPDLALIFGKSKTYPRRGSSAIWESPIGSLLSRIGESFMLLLNLY